ncbi:M61 family metallopeptidase [Singulisphaera sp. PoT]|uniref:M61 family metallopeptidase n=1 Tax=Singulisphaera sp. PoT TaxID=3411797 RepID=UPI003BF4C050
MRIRPWCLLACVAGLVVPGPSVASEPPAPIVTTLRFPALGAHLADVEMSIPAKKRATVDLMMAAWSPGFYRIEDYANSVQSLGAWDPGGKSLRVWRVAKNRWRVETKGTDRAVVVYRLLCDRHSTTTNWVGTDYALLNGPATFLKLVEAERRPYDVRVSLPSTWTRSLTALPQASPDRPNHYRAEDYDGLIDAPIVAGNPSVHSFKLEESEHLLVDVGNLGAWDGERAANDLAKVVLANRRFWGMLPFKKYVFLNVFREGGGGLEHKDSCLLTTDASVMASPQSYLRWLEFAGHEYFHAFNVKRLRPVELGPFDYEKPARTRGLWVAEGLTTYYGELLTIRAGFGGQDDFLAMMSGHIAELQGTPGRLVQTLEQSSWDVWATSTSGIGLGGSRTAVSFYTKGPVVAFLLDARIRRSSGGRKSLDDVMRLAFARHGGARGFTPDEFRKAVEEATGLLLGDWLHKALATTEELDYTEAFQWYGLQFTYGDGQAKGWTLAPRADATEDQRARLRGLIAPAQDH